ncbi:hypothetical protein HY500_01760 [Candidatus Woesearchaeota archaeon]|nr:hypothetical protein [Candidatus Woesearchaeota archaeon]
MSLVPEIIEDSIGYTGWQALSWALHHGWVQDYKYLLSQRERRDVGVPETVRLMLYPKRDRHGVISDGARCMFPQRVRPENYDAFRQLMIEGYLLGTDFVSQLGEGGVVSDRDGKNQLEGELRRFWAQQRKVSPADVKLSAHHEVQFYCEVHRLNGEAYIKFSKHLGLLVD